MSVAFIWTVKSFWSAVFLCFAAFNGANAASPSATNGIPFEYSEGFLWVQIEVPQSARPLNFLFDTGAEISVINAGTVKMLGLSGGRTIHVQGVQAATTGHWPVRLAAKAGNVELPSKYLSLDLSQLAKSCSRPLDGLLGADFIQGKVVEIDFQSHLIRFCEQISPAKSDIDLPLKVSGQCFCVPVRVNSQKPQWVRLDTGCATPLQWVTSDTGADAKSKIPAIGLAGLSIPQAQTTVSLGGQQFDQIPTGIHRRAIFSGEAGLLGNGLLSRFKTVTIDTKSARLVLRPI
ncbi:MAG TPA: aspartyl protease family protein [Verrucomicrobiae bacterium]|nr:aspartyl protease family protein [Verrucomicrobiae bacterium]